MAKYDETAVKSRYGRAPKDDDLILNYAKAVKAIVGADGSIPASEQKALKKGLERLGASDDVQKTVDGFDPKGAKVEDLLTGFRKGGVRARALLRDAIEISWADGHYAKEEQEATAKAAAALGVDEQTLHSIEALVEMERGVHRLQKVLFPKK